MPLRVVVLGGLVAALLAACSSSGSGSDGPESIDPSAYFPTTAGLHFEYDFATDGVYESGKRYVTYQPANDGFQSTFIYSSASLASGGYGYGNFFANDDAYITGHSVTGSADHRGYHVFVRLPDQVVDGESYTGFEMEFAPRLVAEAEGFSDVLVLDFTSELDTFVGTGTLYLARDVGLVRLDFVHTEDGRFGAAGEIISYTLASFDQGTLGAISGAVRDASGVPVNDAIVTVGVSPGFHDERFGAVRSDSSGSFSYPIYFVADAPITWIVAGVQGPDDDDDRINTTVTELSPRSADDLDLGVISLPSS